MKELCTAEEMRSYEGYLMETLGIPSLLLMERAASYVAQAVCDMCRFGYSRKVLIVAGRGNNGADGLAAARMLCEKREFSVSVYIAGNSSHASEAWLVQDGILKRMGMVYETGLDTALAQKPDVIVDALFGIGFHRQLSAEVAALVESINRYRAETESKVISVDIPSGLHADSGRALPVAVRADRTVTFGCRKRGMYLNEGRRYCGVVQCGAIGVQRPGGHDIHDLLPESTDLDRLLPARDPLGHKGTFGKVLCITGSEEMPGAMLLSAKAALEAGAGMVKVLSPGANRDLLMQELPEAMYVPMDQPNEARLAKELAWADTVLLGCGLGKERAAEFLRTRAMAECDKKMVIDADGLNALAEQTAFLRERKKRGQATILTPHPGEFVRLFPQEEKGGWQSPERVRALAVEYGAVLAAKSATTLVSDGTYVYYNTLGNDGMATAGSGDVLAGITAALACVCKDAVTAALCAVLLHAACGQKAAERAGSARALRASGMVKQLPDMLDPEGLRAEE